MSDLDDLIQHALPDDPRLCEALLRDHYAYVYRLAFSILNDPHEADDAAQETFIRVQLNLRRYKAGTQFKGWLTAITVNICRDLLRRHKTKHKLTQLLMSFGLLFQPPMPVEESVIENEARERIRLAVAALDEKHRLPIILRYMHSLSIREIARILNVSQGTIHSRIHYAHTKLRARLTEQDQAPNR